MLSPSSIEPVRTDRASSTWSIDSGYGPGVLEDSELDFVVSFCRGLPDDTLTNLRQLDAGDCPQTNSIQSQHRKCIGLRIDCLTKLDIEDDIVIKKEDESFEPSTPRLKVCTAFSNPSSPDPISPASPSEVRRSHARKASSKLPSQAVARLNDWLDVNRLHPYPTAETKQALAQACSITVKQVTTWFTNTRQRQLKFQENGTGRSGNDNNQTPTQASRKGKKKDYGRANGASPTDGFLSPLRLSPCASVSEHSSGEADNWQCTFCRVPLTAKSWRRHEETQHYIKSQWTCLALGPRIQLPSCSSTICPFCELRDPDDSHFLHYHRVGDCLCKDAKERTFGRPDHLQQHARNFHKCQKPLNDLVRDAWRTNGPGSIDNQTWTCGFCSEVLSTWDARATHIAGHFKNGLTMAQWCDDSVSQVTVSREQTLSRERSISGDVSLDMLASMGTTIAGPSNQGAYPTNHARIDSAQYLQAQPVPTTIFGSAPTTFSDIDPFCMYGNPIDSFDPSFSIPTTYYPTVSSTPATFQNVDASAMDFSVVRTDEFGNPVIDYSGMHSW